ncbi:hypothetical protein BJP48_09520 [Paenibacillus odorifer]|nr:hypothetical protein BJP47_23990 [Paenibacillus odorifer]OMD21074.1 hypothetical protein BJP48_09520 [Paenibacillus odorifer]
MPGFLSTIALLIKELTLLVSYVRNNAFPQPLSEQEESRYLGMMAEGDAKARNLLIEHNLRLVAHIVKRLWTRYDVKESDTNDSIRDIFILNHYY